MSNIRIRFHYDPVRDAQNILDSAKQVFGKEVTFLVGMDGCLEPSAHSFPELVRATVAFQSGHAEFVRSVTDACMKHWNAYESAVSECLQEIFQRPFPRRFVDAYVTSCTRCPYDPKGNSFMVSVFASPVDVAYTCAHELFHLQFYQVYAEMIESGAIPPQSDLLEAFVVVLDEVLPYHAPILGGMGPTMTEAARCVRESWKRTADLRVTVQEVWELLVSYQ